jgi:predicted metal-dependent HD superfamily phosphohydrolase
MTDTTLLRTLMDRWNDLARRIGASDDSADVVLHQLLAAYSEPARHYHNLQHIADMLAILRRYGPAREPELLELAVWFHDAVYDSRAKDNEERSAALATEALHRLGMATERIARVADLIRMTREHRAEPGDADAPLCLDADLAILGTSPEEYNEYARAIRKEYAWVSEADYRAGRRAVLERFLARPRIYGTPGVIADREAVARRNLAAEIADLS